MEDRVKGVKAGERLALVALGAVVLVTAVWWLLALWPVDAPPAWLSRTRSVCFGTGPTGLPDGGGWILLVGQPASMLSFLMLVWGRSVAGGLRTLARRKVGRLVLVSVTLILAAGAGAAVARVATAVGPGLVAVPESPGRPVRLNRPSPPLRLTDQNGDVFSLEEHRGRSILLTFAYAHCETVCPLIVHDVLAARAGLGDEAPMVVVVTLDPWRDTPARLRSIARQWSMGPDDRVLGGDTTAVLTTLDRWDVHVSRDPDTGAVDHAPIVYVIDPAGLITFALAGDARGLATLLRSSGKSRRSL